MDVSNHDSCKSTSDDQKHAKPTAEEVYFLRMIHLLFRVACPVVRMTFDHEIQPNQLRRSLDKNKTLMNKRYRKKEKIINDCQWDLLYRSVKEKIVTSEDFDISLMINLLRTLAPNITIGDLYPVRTDTSIDAMLSRIKYRRNEAIQSFEGKLSQKQFEKYWNESGQAILKLVSSHLVNIEDDTLKTQLIGRLIELNPIRIDYDKLCLFIDMSEKFPSVILQQIISEYCIFNKLVMEDVLREEKHDLFHKRVKAEPCCECTTEYSTYIKVIPENLWEALFKMTKVRSSSCLHSCTAELKKCYERFVPKRIDTSVLSVSMPLILNIPSVLNYVISRLCVSGFSNFLVQNQHTLYHSMEKRRCCKCKNDPIEKILINKKEWNKLYKKEDHVSCTTKDCCCHFSVINGIEYSSLDDTLLSKIFYVSGPISVLNKIGQDRFLYFLSWTVDDEALRNALTELSQIIHNKSFSDIVQHISSSNVSQLGEMKTQEVEARDWLYRQFRHQKETTELSLPIIVRDTVGLSVKSVQIPTDFSLPHRTQKFTDITSEENNFLVVVYGLTKIVYPVIRKHFNTECPAEVLDKIRMGIYAHYCNDSNNGEYKSLKKRTHLTEKQREQLFSPKQEDSNTFDLELMIFLLKQRPEEEKGKKDDDYQLDVIDSIRREIFQSSSGMLNVTKFNITMESITKAVLHLGGAIQEENLLNLHHIKNILE
ncbi:uncharacterized protein LOC127721351 [Mytilus californianus]|uniref:uncharacterized protein LOC127721351 n=1 Tax=Mytilus californianus TaxID=6549 RepID=UPI002247C91A|nr:uncharacterized protein LOC127721351 [Mytilus californianus]